MKTKVLEATEHELDKALEDLFYAATQCATYFYWMQYGKPLICTYPEVEKGRLDIYLTNGIVEATLMFVRKTIEFFKPQGVNDRKDSIYSYLYIGYTKQEWILSEDEYYKELHKRVGHITVYEARIGKVQWPIHFMVVKALKKWIEFFSDISQITIETNPNRKEVCLQYVVQLTRVLNTIELNVEKLKNND